MLPEGWRDVKRALAVRLDNIGDVVMLGPALRSLRAALPGAHIALMASPAGSAVAPMLPWIDEVITERVVWQDASGAMPLGPEREAALVERIRAGRFDAAIIFTSFSQSPYPPAYVCYLAGVPLRIGQSKEFGGGLLTEWVKPLPDHAHQVDRNLHLLAQAGLPIAGRHLELHIPPDVQRAGDSLLLEAGVETGQPFILLAPGASCAARRYDPNRFAEVARLLIERKGWRVVVVGSQREKAVIAPVLSIESTMLASLVGRTSIPQLAAVIARARLLIANDSGPMHIADALRRPMLILFSGTEYESQWRPRAAPAKLLRRPTDCSPCYSFNCPYNMECLDISAEGVVDAALSMLNGSVHHHRAESAAVGLAETTWEAAP